MVPRRETLLPKDVDVSCLWLLGVPEVNLFNSPSPALDAPPTLLPQSPGGRVASDRSESLNRVLYGVTSTSSVSFATDAIGKRYNHALSTFECSQCIRLARLACGDLTCSLRSAWTVMTLARGSLRKISSEYILLEVDGVGDETVADPGRMARLKALLSTGL